MIGCLVGSARVASLGESVTVMVADGHEGIAPVVMSPRLGSLDRRPRRDRGNSDVERQRHDRRLHLTITGLPARIAQREVNEQEPRHPCLFHDVAGAPDDNCRDPSFFQPARNQTHGLVTDGSKRNEQRDVDAILLAPHRDLVGVETGLALAVLGWDTEEAVVQRTDPTVGSK